MGKLKIKILSLLLAVVVISGIFVPVHMTEAAGVSSKSFTVTLDKKTFRHIFEVKSKKKTGIIVDVKILKVTGKAESGDDEWGILWVGYENAYGKGSLFDKLVPNDFKKGAVLTSEEGFDGTSEIDFYMPSGIKKMKIKITFRTEDNSKNLIKVKKYKKSYWNRV